MPGIKLKPFSESLVRNIFVKGVYYDKNESVIKLAEILSKKTKDTRMRNRVDLIRNAVNLIELHEHRLKQARLGQRFMKIFEVESTERKLVELRNESSRALKDMVSFCLKILEDEGLAESQLTIYQIKKLPLTLGGGDDDEDYDEGYD